jgi:hypothetical protein
VESKAGGFFCDCQLFRSTDLGRKKMVSWADVDHTETPGRFTLPNGTTVEIRDTHIAIWKAEPRALFARVPFGTHNESNLFVLGSHEVPDAQH